MEENGYNPCAHFADIKSVILTMTCEEKGEPKSICHTKGDEMRWKLVTAEYGGHGKIIICENIQKGVYITWNITSSNEERAQVNR